MITVRSEPRGHDYRDLIRYCADRCSSFSLTWQDELAFSQDAERLAEHLQPSLIEEKRAKEWPGTRLGGRRRATVRMYRVEPDSLRAIREVPSLYAWRAPDFPEDLCFYLPSGDCFLATIAHEADAFFPDDDLVLECVLKLLPGLELAEE